MCSLTNQSPDGRTEGCREGALACESDSREKVGTDLGEGVGRS